MSGPESSLQYMAHDTRILQNGTTAVAGVMYLAISLLLAGCATTGSPVELGENGVMRCESRSSCEFRALAAAGDGATPELRAALLRVGTTEGQRDVSILAQSSTTSVTPILVDLYCTSTNNVERDGILDVLGLLCEKTYASLLEEFLQEEALDSSNPNRRRAVIALHHTLLHATSGPNSKYGRLFGVATTLSRSDVEEAFSTLASVAAEETPSRSRQVARFSLDSLGRDDLLEPEVRKMYRRR